MPVVAPYMGAWIETTYSLDLFSTFLSLPTWGRGLKLQSGGNVVEVWEVAPYMGAWIETSNPLS